MKITDELNKFRSAVVADLESLTTSEYWYSDYRPMIYHFATFYLLTIILTWLMTLLMFFSGVNVGFVLSESVEHTFQRGDWLFMTKYPEKPIQVGDVVVFDMKKSIHFYRFIYKSVSIAREVFEIEKLNGTEMFLVNYNNSVPDRESESGKLWMTEKDIIGQLWFTLPYAGILDCLKYEEHYGSLILYFHIIVLTSILLVAFIYYPWTKFFILGISDDNDDALPTSLSPKGGTSPRFNTSRFMIACRVAPAAVVFALVIRKFMIIQ